MSDWEKQALADKRVTVAEMDRSTAIFLSCVRAAGATAEFNDAADVKIGPDAYGVSWNSDNNDTDNTMESKVDACRQQVDAVTAVWVLENQATADEVAAGQQAFPACAKKMGLPIASNATWQDAAQVASKYLVAKPEEVPKSIDVPGLSSCMHDLAKVTTTALPGLAEALANYQP